MYVAYCYINSFFFKKGTLVKTLATSGEARVPLFVLLELNSS